MPSGEDNLSTPNFLLITGIANIKLCLRSLTETMGNEWQTVPGPKSKAKAKESKGKNTSDGNTGSTSDPASAVLAQIDADWRQSKQNGTRIANGGGFNSREVRSFSRFLCDVTRLSSTDKCLEAHLLLISSIQLDEVNFAA